MKIERIAYCGHSAIFLEGSEKVIAVDPWFTGNNSCPDICQTPERIDFIALTHGHSDHAGDAVRLAKTFGTKICATFELATLLGKAGVPEENLIPMNKGGTVDLGGIRISLTHALHSNSFDLNGETYYAGEACGIVIKASNTCIYHAGDTALFSDMSIIGKTYQPDIACLPIGDRFTMGPVEAAEAAKLIGCRFVIPIHHSTFPMLTGTPEAFKKACINLDLEVVALKPGESYTI